MTSEQLKAKLQTMIQDRSEWLAGYKVTPFYTLANTRMYGIVHPVHGTIDCQLNEAVEFLTQKINAGSANAQAIADFQMQASGRLFI